MAKRDPIYLNDPIAEMNDRHFQIFEKVLVQNIQFGLSPSLTGEHLGHRDRDRHLNRNWNRHRDHHRHRDHDRQRDADALRSVPRWRFVVAAFPHVMQCAASMLQYRFGCLLKVVNIMMDAHQERFNIQPRLCRDKTALHTSLGD